MNMWVNYFIFFKQIKFVSEILLHWGGEDSVSVTFEEGFPSLPRVLNDIHKMRDYSMVFIILTYTSILYKMLLGQPSSAI